MQQKKRIRHFWTYIKRYPYLFLLLSGLLIGGFAATWQPVSSKDVFIIPDKQPITVCFSPKGNMMNFIADAINKAERDIRIFIFSFTSKVIAEALIAAKDRGVDIGIIADNTQASSKYSQIEELYKVDIPNIYLDKRDGVAHNKYVVIDKQLVVTGSSNFSKNAEKQNRENMLCVSSREVAQLYYANWMHHRDSKKVTKYGDLTPD